VRALTSVAAAREATKYKIAVQGDDAMSATGLDVFDTTLHKTNIWLNDLMQVAGLAGQTQGLFGLEGNPARAA
jgi:hypothetical protein